MEFAFVAERNLNDGRTDAQQEIIIAAVTSGELHLVSHNHNSDFNMPGAFYNVMLINAG